MAKSLQKAEHLVRNHPANKELMELGFGCELKDKDEKSKVRYINTVRSYGCEKCEPDEVFIECIGDNMCPQSYDSEAELYKYYKILGKPAHLEHYLRVLEECDNEDYYLDTIGQLCRENKDFEFQPVGIEFNLTTGKPATEKDAEEFIKLIENLTTNLQDIPEKDAEKLCQLLNLE
jgi:hypothetical protein